jgi:hypothetical protein
MESLNRSITCSKKFLLRSYFDVVPDISVALIGEYCHLKYVLSVFFFQVVQFCTYLVYENTFFEIVSENLSYIKYYEGIFI